MSDAARQRAMRAVAAARPSHTVTDAVLRAEEEERWVYAVFHHAPGPRGRPGAYALVAVSRDGDAVTELDLHPDSPYWIHGRK